MLKVENFQASVRCLNRFREWYGVVIKCISGEASDVPMNSVNEWRNGEVAALIKKYNPNDVFNADEAGVLFQLELKKTLAQKRDKLIDFDREIKKKKRKILLIDNCTPHNEPPKLDYIRVKYLPPNCTAVLQLLDQGINRAVKLHYKTVFEDEATDESSEDEKAVIEDDVFNVTLSEALSSLENLHIHLEILLINQFKKLKQLQAYS
ncbi:tigger transposable element-derived protein 6-like [Melanaphis sacchari]|uniref:tigger transposable element-derived protein 6-like n=1 Tax=Melanaphis sacchari TaxID=742174 RepID=UPI000DC154DF|nr:tigger transposable element-derived protein 6-like [Melanaphis sacchari]